MDSAGIVGIVILGAALVVIVRVGWVMWTVRRDLRAYDEGKRE